MKDYMKDNGKVRMGTSNIAKMNIFEWMWYNKHIAIDTLKEALERFVLGGLMFFGFPLIYPITAYLEIRAAKKEMREDGKR